MADVQTLARPYAVAVFRHAQGADAVAAWADCLSRLAAAVATPEMSVVISAPQVSAEDAAAVLEQAAGEAAPGLPAFLRLLAEYDRLALLPAIASAYTRLQREAENRLDAVVRTALPLDEAQAKGLEAGLASRLGRSVSLQFEDDAELIGGVVIESGDIVIDASLRGDLTRLAQQLH